MTSLAALVLVVRDLDHALLVYEQGLGFVRSTPIEDVPGLGARRALLRGAGVEIELLEPHDDTKPPGRFLSQRGEGVFALTVGVDDPGRATERLVRGGVSVVEPGGDPPGVFVRPRDGHGLLIEVAPAPLPDEPE